MKYVLALDQGTTSSRAAFTASSTEKHGMPRGVATPYFRRISFAWYSWIFMSCCAGIGSRIVSARPGPAH